MQIVCIDVFGTTLFYYDVVPAFLKGIRGVVDGICLAVFFDAQAGFLLGIRYSQKHIIH